MTSPPGKTFSTEIYVAFGDCDPAGIVYYPNFYRWFDVSTQRMGDSVGLDLQSMRREHGWLGMPLVEAHARFVRPASHGDTIRIDTRVVEWTAFRQHDLPLWNVIECCWGTGIVAAIPIIPLSMVDHSSSRTCEALLLGR